MAKRSTKFYRQNEAEVMKQLGFEPTKNSGAGWIEKEDGQNEFAICQLKSTDKQSISIKQNDLHILEYNANVAHKLPVFAIQFLNTNEVWVMIKPDDIEAFMGILEGNKEIYNKRMDVLEYLEENVDKKEEIDYNITKGNKDVNKSLSARKAYLEQREKEREQKEKEYKRKQREGRNKYWQKRNSKEKD